MSVSFCKRYLSSQDIITSKVLYDPGFSFKFEMHNQFLSGRRLLGLQKIMGVKGRSSSKKIYIEIGLHVLKLREVKKGKTKKGAPKITVSFSKPPSKYEIDDKEFTDTYGNNSDMSYLDIDCTHMIQKVNSGDFSKMWFKNFTMAFTSNMFDRLPKGKYLKCLVAHKEEAFIVNGVQMRYEKDTLHNNWGKEDDTLVNPKQSSRLGRPIVIIKPEVVKVYHIDTPDEDIKFDYKKLYKPLKK